MTVSLVEEASMKSISLFTGSMGLDLGLERAGIRTVVSVEKDPTCRKTIALNRPDVIQFDDVFQAKGKDLLEAAGGAVDVVVGGPPCQTFSTAGKRQLLDDPRGRCIPEYLRLVREIRPRFFVMENVKGIQSVKIGEKPLMEWLAWRFRRLGYRVDHWLLDSHDYGVAQKRLRIIMVGGLERSPEKPRPSRTRKVLGDVIRDLEDDPGECGKFSPRRAAFLDKIPEGGNWKSLSKKDQDVAMGTADRKSGGLTAFFRRLSYDRPCPTLTTSPTQRATTLCHPQHTRPLSVEEYRRVQGFPEPWKLHGSISQKYQQLGNAVPVGMAAAIGRSLVRAARW